MLPPPYNYDEYGPLDDESEESESMDTFDDDESYVRRRPPYGRKLMPRYGGIPARVFHSIMVTTKLIWTHMIREAAIAWATIIPAVQAGTPKIGIG